MAMVMGWTARATATESNATVAAQESAMAPDARVRGVSTRLVAIIITATAQSKTFRGLVEQIGTTDGVVYVAEGQCGQGVRACLLHSMTAMGPNRLLRILVDPRTADRDLMSNIGHELQHAVEVLSDRNVRSFSAMTLLYKRICNACGRRIETDAAIAAGEVVRSELQKSLSCRAVPSDRMKADPGSSHRA